MVLTARMVAETPKEGSENTGEMRTSPEPWHMPARRSREKRWVEHRRRRGAVRVQRPASLGWGVKNTEGEPLLGDGVPGRCSRSPGDGNWRVRRAIARL